MRGIKLIVAVALATLATTATASAACDLTISNGPQTGITEGPTGTFTSTAASAVLDVGTLTDRLSVGNANVNTGTDPCGGQQGNLTISNAVTWSTPSSLTMFSVGDAEFNASLTATDGSAAFAVQASLGVAQPAGTISVAGPTTVNGGLASVSLTSAGNDFGQSISVPAAPLGVAITDANAIALAGVNTGSNFTLNAASVGQTAALNVSGATIITASGPVSLNASNAFTGPVAVASALAPVALNANGDLTLGNISASSLDATASDELLNFGNVTVTGATTLAAPTSIGMTDSDNNFGGAVSSTTNGVLTLHTENPLVLGTTSSAGADVFSDGAMTQTGAISDGGQFEVQGDGGVTLTNASNNFDDLSVASAVGSVAVRDANSVNLQAVEVAGSGAATVTAGNDLIVPDLTTFFTAGAMTLVADANAGSAVGPGGIDIAGDRAITSIAAPVRLYTAQRSQNSISPLATLNGATFTPGPEFVDSATEVWNTAFPAGTATDPFTIFYKQAAPAVPVDPPTPDTTLTGTPKKKIKTKKKKVKVSFEFTSNVVGSTFTCALDGRAISCNSPFQAKVKKGKHTFSVAATATGKIDPTPESFSFKVKRKKRR